MASREVIVPLANDPIMLDRFLKSFRPLKNQNPSLVSDYKDGKRILQKKCGDGGGGVGGYPIYIISTPIAPLNPAIHRIRVAAGPEL